MILENVNIDRCDTTTILEDFNRGRCDTTTEDLDNILSLPRNWRHLRSEWRLAFQDYDDIGQCPPTSFDTIAKSDITGTPSTQPLKAREIEYPGLKNIALREAIFLTHKAGALLRSLHRDIIDNDISYPEVTGYMASFFLVDALLILLGVRLFKQKYLFDFSKTLNHPSRAKLYEWSKRVGHKQKWSLLKKILSVTEESPLDTGMLRFFDDLPASEFANSRNKIQYRPCVWPHKDLHHRRTGSETLAAFDTNIYLTNFDSSSPLFGIYLFFIMIRATTSLLHDISYEADTHNNGAIQRELNLIKRNARRCQKKTKILSWLPF